MSYGHRIERPRISFPSPKGLMNVSRPESSKNNGQAVTSIA